jgi:peptide/nickel transport system substrate-binding protein
VALFAVLAMLAAACSSNKPSTKTTAGGKAGGTFHWVTDNLFWVLSGNGFDPSFEYLTTNWDIFSALMLRGLTTYTHRPNSYSTVPDLATGPGTYSADHMSITYTLKSGVKFGPPVSRVITSKDIAYAIERVATSNLDTGGYPSYFTDFVKGLDGLAKDYTYKDIPGIETPDDNTIKFNFSKPNYDWDFRMSMPAAAPIPPEIGKCFKAQLEYGQYVISSGPYMIDGIDKLDPSSCKAFRAKKPSGFSFNKELDLVRNPNYDPATDSKTVREALPDRYEITQDTNAKDCFERVETNKIDWCDAAVTGDVIQTYQTTPALQNLIHTQLDNSTWFLSMNLTEPPFDDIHVRKAVNYALDKNALRRLRGGPLSTDVAEHIIPPSLLGGQLAAGQFDPYGPNHDGDLAKAKEEMKMSKYDKNGDGLCDDQSPVAGEHRTVCGSKSGPIVVINRQTEPYTEYEPVWSKALEGLGMKVRYSRVPSFYGVAGDISAHPVIGVGGGWGPDWPDPGIFLEQIMTSGAIHDQTYNVGLVGITKAQAKQFGTLFPSTGVPSIDADYQTCSGKATGSADRTNCFIELDKKIMNDIVPWAPYRWGKALRVVSAAVTGYDFDLFSTDASLAHMGIDPSKQAS